MSDPRWQGDPYTEEEIENFVDRMGEKIGHDETCSYGLKASTLEILEHFVTRSPACEYFRVLDDKTVVEQENHG